MCYGGLILSCGNPQNKWLQGPLHVNTSFRAKLCGVRHVLWWIDSVLWGRRLILVHTHVCTCVNSMRHSCKMRTNHGEFTKFSLEVHMNE